MINLCNTLLPNDRVQAIQAENSTTIEPIPITDSVTDVVVEPILTTVSTDSKIVFRVLLILYFFFDLWFLSLEYLIISLM